MRVSPKPAANAPSKAAQAAQGGRSLSNAGQACRECRRRKGKCDSKLPVCSVCQRYNRHCLYDKHSRSALTRKHLTEVEERLERAEALLKTLLSEEELSKVLVQGLFAKDPVAQVDSSPSFNISEDRSTVPPGQTPSSTQSFGGGSGSSTTAVTHENPFEPFSARAQAQFQQNSSFQAPPPSTSNPPDNSALLRESLPSAADDDFEWDEREPLWTSFDPAVRSSSFHSSEDLSIPKITDGMATLTANEHNTGFLGSVSGAALLRIISESKGGNQKPGIKQDSAEDRRSSLPELQSFQGVQGSSGAWLRSQPVMTRAFVNALIDAYFAHYHPTFPILHEATFREQYQNLNDRPKGTWHILANLVAALGSFVSSTCSDDTDINLFNAVKSQLTIESLEAGSLGLVQAFAMAANYLQKRNRPNSGYNYGGVALRLAISLGLHKEFQGWQTAPLKKEIRRRVWWSLCVLDVGATVTYGRPLNWPQVGVEARFPLNIEDQDLTAVTTAFPPERRDTTIYSYVTTQSAYHLTTIRIYNRLISNPPPSAAELINLDDELIGGWRNSLPPYFCDDNLPLSPEHLLGHSISRWRFRVMRIVMYRPFLLKWAQEGVGSMRSPTSQFGKGVKSIAASEDEAVRRCFQASEECISIIYNFWTTATHTRLAAWYVLYFLLQAALIPVHCLRKNPTHPSAGSWISQVRSALDVINALTLNPSAQKCRDIIYRLCGESLNDGSRGSNQYTADFSQAESYPYEIPATDQKDMNIDSWMTEIDTAIDGYDSYCDRLTNAVIPGMDGISAGDVGDPDAEAFSVANWGLETGTGVHEWDWGLML